MAKDGVHFVITGGTIDSVYDGSKDTVVPSKESILPEVMSLVKTSMPFEFTEVCMKDSRELNGSDREEIYETCKQSEYSRIVITHGTYTMGDTARFLMGKPGLEQKTIIVTGSLLPIKGFSPSDGTFNLGYAIAQTEYLKHGVYQALHAQVYAADVNIASMSKERHPNSVFSKN